MSAAETALAAAADTIRELLRDPQLAELIDRRRAVLVALNGVPMSVREVAQAAGISKSPAHRHLQALVEVGLADHRAGGWVAADVSDPVGFAPNGSDRCVGCGAPVQMFAGKPVACACASEPMAAIE